MDKSNKSYLSLANKKLKKWYKILKLPESHFVQKFILLTHIILRKFLYQLFITTIRTKFGLLLTSIVYQKLLLFILNFLFRRAVIFLTV